METSGTFECRDHGVVTVVSGDRGQHRHTTLLPRGLGAATCALLTAPTIEEGELLPGGKPRYDPKPCHIIRREE